MKETLVSGRINETRAPSYIVNPLTVTKNSHGKSRLILDLRHVIFFVYKDRIKFDDWRTMQHFVDNKGFSIKIRDKLRLYFLKKFGEGNG